MVVALTISVSLLIVACIACGVLYRQRSVCSEQCAELHQALQSAQTVAASLDRDLAVLRETTAQNEKRFAELREQSQQAFRALAGEALRESSQQFLQLAEQRLRVEQGKAGEQLEARQKAIEQLIGPVKETLEKYNSSLQEIEKSRRGAYESLMKDLELFRADQRRLREETGNLVAALRRSEVRGRWGEVVLERVLELSGLTKGIHFVTQVAMDGEVGKLRPDVVVRLPQGRSIVIDAKTPMAAFLEALDCKEQVQRDICLDRHMKLIQEKVKELASKPYTERVAAEFGQTADFTVLFIPSEGFLYAAVARNPELIEEALTQRIVIATPGTLIGLLRIVAMGWREERLAENAQAISDQGRILHERLCTLAEHVAKLGKSVGDTVRHYNSFLGALDSRVLPAVRKLEDLHAGSAKEMPILPAVELAPQGCRSLTVAAEAGDER